MPFGFRLKSAKLLISTREIRAGAQRIRRFAPAVSGGMFRGGLLVTLKADSYSKYRLRRMAFGWCSAAHCGTTPDRLFWKGCNGWRRQGGPTMNADAMPLFSCPACRSSRVCKTHYEGVIEQAVLRLIEIGPFLCNSCHLRFYMFLLPSKSRPPELARVWSAREAL
jgi:hypothetical protein